MKSIPEIQDDNRAAAEKERRRFASVQLQKLDTFMNAIAASSFVLQPGRGDVYVPDYELAGEILKSLKLRRCKLLKIRDGAL